MDTYLDVDLAGALHALAHAAPAIQLLVLVSFGLWVVLNRVLAWLDARERKREKAKDAEAKATRDTAFRALLTEVSTEMRAISAQGAQVARDVSERVEGLTHAVTTLQRTVQDVRDRQAEVIGRAESLAIIAAKFNDYLRNEAVAVFDQSLRRNAFRERQEFVQERVKTALGEIVEGARASLERDYRALSVDLEPFFPVRGGGQGGRRYTIVDQLWDCVRPLYEGDEPVDQRVEEMRMAVRNAVADHVQVAASAAADIYSDSCHLARAGEAPEAHQSRPRASAALLAAAALLGLLAGCWGAPRLPTPPKPPVLPSAPLAPIGAVQQAIIHADTGTKADHRRAVAQIADADLAQIDGAMVWLLLASIALVIVGVVIAWYGGVKLGSGLMTGGATGMVLSIAVRALEPYAIYIAIAVLATGVVGVLAHFGPRWVRHWKAPKPATTTPPTAPQKP